MVTEETLLDIGDRLRFVLFGLECTLNIEFDPGEVGRLFAEAVGEDVSSAAMDYTFHASRGLSVTGRVDDYEPASVLIRVESRRLYEPSLSAIVERAKFPVYHLGRDHAEHA